MLLLSCSSFLRSSCSSASSIHPSIIILPQVPQEEEADSAPAVALEVVAPPTPPPGEMADPPAYDAARLGRASDPLPTYAEVERIKMSEDGLEPEPEDPAALTGQPTKKKKEEKEKEKYENRSGREGGTVLCLKKKKERRNQKWEGGRDCTLSKEEEREEKPDVGGGRDGTLSKEEEREEKPEVGGGRDCTLSEDERNIKEYINGI